MMLAARTGSWDALRGRSAWRAARRPSPSPSLAHCRQPYWALPLALLAASQTSPPSAVVALFFRPPSLDTIDSRRTSWDGTLIWINVVEAWARSPGHPPLDRPTSARSARLFSECDGGRRNGKGRSKALSRQGGSHALGTASHSCPEDIPLLASQVLYYFEYEHALGQHPSDRRAAGGSACASPRSHPNGSN